MHEIVIPEKSVKKNLIALFLIGLGMSHGSVRSGLLQSLQHAIVVQPFDCLQLHFII